MKQIGYTFKQIIVCKKFEASDVVWNSLKNFLKEAMESSTAIALLTPCICDELLSSDESAPFCVSLQSNLDDLTDYLQHFMPSRQ